MLNNVLAPRRGFGQLSNFNDLVKSADAEWSRRIQGLSAVGVPTILLTEEGRVRARNYTGENDRWALVDPCPRPVSSRALSARNRRKKSISVTSGDRSGHRGFRRKVMVNARALDADLACTTTKTEAAISGAAGMDFCQVFQSFSSFVHTRSSVYR